MKRVFYILIAAVAAVAFTGCQSRLEAPSTFVSFEELANRRFAYGNHDYTDATVFGVIDIHADEYITLYSYDHRIGHLTFDENGNTPGCVYSSWDVTGNKVSTCFARWESDIKEIVYDASTVPARLLVTCYGSKEPKIFVEDTNFDCSNPHADYWFPWNVQDADSPWLILFEDE